MTNSLVVVVGLLVAVGLGLLSLLGLVMGIVMAAMGKWKGALLWGVAFVVFLVMSVGLVVAGLMFAEPARPLAMVPPAAPAMRVEIPPPAAPAMRVETLPAALRTQAPQVKALTPSVDWSAVDAEWFTYDDHPDWNRIPLRWPFEVRTDIDWEVGQVRKNVAAGRSKLDSDTERLTMPAIDMFAADAKMIVFRIKVESPRPQRWGFVVFEDERVIRQFPAELAMWDAAQAAGWTGAAKLETLEQQWDRYWGME